MYQTIMDRAERAKIRILQAGGVLADRLGNVDASPLTRLHTGGSEIESWAVYLETVAAFIEASAEAAAPISETAQDGPSEAVANEAAPLSLGDSQAVPSAPQALESVPVEASQATPIAIESPARVTRR